MKSYKILFISLFLLFVSNVQAKRYENGEIANALDLCVFLQRAKMNGACREEKNAKKGKIAAIRQKVICAIEQNEAVIVSAPLLRALFNLYKYNGYSEDIQKTGFKKTMETFVSGQWCIYGTKDNRDFAVLIPKGPYEEAIEHGVLNLKKIGLRPDRLDIIASGKTTINVLERCFVKNNFSTTKKINLPVFKSIFSQEEMPKKVNKRIYLNGHGLFTKEICAQLDMMQLVDFFKFLKEINCSFVGVSSCHVSANIEKALGFFTADELPFIIVGAGMDGVTYSLRVQFKLFFEALNNFFKGRREYLIKELKPFLQNSAEIFINERNESQILIDKFKMAGEKDDPMIEIKSLTSDVLGEFSPMLRYLVGTRPTNTPFIKFPGEKELRLAKGFLNDFNIKHQELTGSFILGQSSIEVEQEVVDIFIKEAINPKIQILAPDVLPQMFSSSNGRAFHYVEQMTVDFRYKDQQYIRMSNRIPLFFAKFHPVATAATKTFFINKIELNCLFDEKQVFGERRVDANMVLENVYIKRFKRSNRKSYEFIFKVRETYFKGSLRKNQSYKDLTCNRIDTIVAEKEIAKALKESSGFVEKLLEFALEKDKCELTKLLLG